ncbi:MAG: hypothetical protein K1X87_11885 [Dehalococcoidia bacterium]|nr:hypothetical protein [Dehalococcoidia bacterium]
MTTQEQTDMVAEMFPIPEGAKRLEWFIGEWTIDGTLQMGEDTLPLTGGASILAAAGGWGLRSELVGQVQGLGTMRENDLFGFDQERGLLHMYSLTNTGNVHDHVGQWRDDGGFDLVYEGVQQGQPYREEMEVRRTGEAAFTIHDVEYVAGALASVMEVELTRR